MFEVGGATVLFLVPGTTGKHLGEVQFSAGIRPTMMLRCKLIEICGRLVKVRLNSEGPV